ncbi:MAG: hypothetical protein LBT10_01995 [Methanobrevibacter sp.]|jgi:parallel beta-helix repeat protein|nr:hypothetical protein [Methanobrevibacter sp.]
MRNNKIALSLVILVLSITLSSVGAIYNDSLFDYISLFDIPKDGSNIINIVYVSVDGDDNNSGTMDDPVQTLQKVMEIVNDGFNIDPSVKVNVAINNLELVNGYSITSGGAIFNNGSDLNLSDCVIDSNTAKEDGGGIFITGGGTNHIINCSFTNNQASNRGGGISITKTSTRCYISDCNFTNNNAQYGDGIHSGQDNNPPIFNCIITNNHAMSYGGGVYVNKGMGNFTCCDISSNSASDGGGININEGIANFLNCSINFNNATDGGGMSIINGTGVITDCHYGNNIAVNGNGGALKNNHHCTFYGSSRSNSHFEFNQARYGGAIYNTINGVINKKTEFRTVFNGNNASQEGGGIYDIGTLINMSYLIMQNNQANTSFGGGAIATVSDISKFKSDNNNYIDNNLPNDFRQLSKGVR